jgi:hypothetical protein
MLEEGQLYRGKKYRKILPQINEAGAQNKPVTENFSK